MTDFLMPPPAAPTNQAPIGPATATGPARSSNSQSTSEDTPAPLESFASVLHKQVAQAARKADPPPATAVATAGAGSETVIATDPLLTAATDPLLTAATDPLVTSATDPLVTSATDPSIAAATDTPDAAAILPLLAQLTASASAKTSADPATSAAKNPADGSPRPIAGLLAKAGDAETQAKETLPQAATETSGPKTRGPTTETPASNEIIPKAAISAETEKPVESAAEPNNKPDGEFSALLNRSSNAHTSTHVATSQTATQEIGTSLRMERPAGHPAWNNELADKMTWMATSQRQQADLVLNPPQLGRVEISLTVTGDQASAVFASPNAAVREMLENSLPRLREILAGAGINLGEAQVGGQSQEQPAQGRNDNRGSGSFRNQGIAATEAFGVATPGLRWQQESRSMVDIYA